MRDILQDLERWLQADQSVAIGTVIQTWGSTPRRVGSKMGITAAGEICGSVSGGCVEGAVVEAGLDVLETGLPQLLHFGVADELAWEVGLACGGTIDIFVNPLDRTWFGSLAEAIHDERPVVAATVISGPFDRLGRTILAVEKNGAQITHHPNIFHDGLDEAVHEAARIALAEGKPARQTISHPQSGEMLDIFLDIILPSPVLVIVGGTHISIALADLAKVMGYRSIIVDPRRSFGNPNRFPHADRLISAWPDRALTEIEINRSTAVAVLTHDPKLDDPALMVALPSQAFYVGALGSKKTQASRRQRLLDAGLSIEHLDRLHGPIGLDIHASTPEEIALSIMAEIVSASAM